MSDPAVTTPGADLRPLLSAVRDQGQRGTCLAFAVTAAHEVARAAGAAVAEDLSEEALYWGCKVVDGHWRSGSRFTSAATALAATGQPLEAVWPYNPARLAGTAYAPPNPPTTDWYQWGLATMPIDAANIRTEIEGGRPVLLGVTVFDTFFRPVGGRIEAPATTDPARGGHAVLAVGHDAGALLIRNSWGATWALAGYAWLSDKYTARHVREAWVIQAATTGTPQASGAPIGDIYESH